MQRSCGLVLLGTFLAACFQVSGTPALAATPAFTVSATNVTMPLSQSFCSNGTCTANYGNSTFMLTSLNGYTGAPQVSCAASNPPAGSTLPTCFEHGLMPALPANGTVTGQILFIAPGQTPPPNPASLLERSGPAASLALAAAFFFGLGFRCRAPRWLALVLLALGMLGGMTAINACGGKSNLNGMTPGTYSYAVTATDSSTGDTATTTISVTIP